MSEMKSRRELGLLVTGGVIAAGAIAAARTAAAEPQPQPDMERAKASLKDAIGFLQAGADNKGGHKVKAIELIQSAIIEIEQGVHFANTH